MKSRGCEETTLAKSHSRTTEILHGNAAVHLLTRRRDEGKPTFHEHYITVKDRLNSKMSITTGKRGGEESF